MCVLFACYEDRAVAVASVGISLNELLCEVLCCVCAPTGRDCLGCAKTGSGKTAAFALPILHRLAEDPYGIFALVLTPTRLSGLVLHV